jgi:uncharacterized protein (DUF1501 family)
MDALQFRANALVNGKLTLPARLGIDRRNLLKATALGGASWLGGVAQLLARDERKASTREPAQSLILIWLAGGASQLETFDPHPGAKIAGDTTAIKTSLEGVQLASGYERLADVMHRVSLVRNVVSKEGDHERGSYAVKTGYRPDPTIVHPSIGAICCHELPVGKTEIPRHISILPGRFISRGGILGNKYDPFKTYDPIGKVPDVSARVPDDRQARRLEDRLVVEQAFARGRARAVDATLHTELMNQARKMMTSEQLAAFDVSNEPAEVRAAYGETPFGRGCLAARRLVEVGVRCVEVTLEGWDSHVNNHKIHAEQAETLDPALTALIGDLDTRGLLDKTIVLCTGEFGRTPKINRGGGRDHWPNGFSMLMAGGRLPRGYVLGETDPEGEKIAIDQGTPVADIHATLLTALGIDPHREVIAPIGRPVKFSDGAPIAKLLT